MDDWKKAGKILLKGGVAVLPTDTIYGLHCLATNKDGVDRIYKLKGRDTSKPFIVLISSLVNLKQFRVTLDDKLQSLLEQYWPGRNSVILHIPEAYTEFAYLHRGTTSLAFRIPNYPPLIQLLRQTGPLISTSANPAQRPPAKNIAEAKAYFGSTVDYYLDAGISDNLPSRVFKLDNNNLTQIR